VRFDLSVWDLPHVVRTGNEVGAGLGRGSILVRDRHVRRDVTRVVLVVVVVVERGLLLTHAATHAHLGR
jgi:hypothetical protein